MILGCSAVFLACEISLGPDRSLIPTDAEPSTSACGCACVKDPLPSCLAPVGQSDGAAADADAGLDAATSSDAVPEAEPDVGAPDSPEDVKDAGDASRPG
jgi:hypothetical protein